MGFFSFIAKFSAVFAAGYAMLFAATTFFSGIAVDILLKFAGGILIIVDVFALSVWLVNAVWYCE